MATLPEVWKPGRVIHNEFSGTTFRCCEDMTGSHLWADDDEDSSYFVDIDLALAGDWEVVSDPTDTNHTEGGGS